VLADAQRVTVVSSPAGSGKSSLVRSWIDDAGLTEDTAWVPVRREERDPQALWLSVLDSLRGTCPGSALVRELTAAPHLDGWTVVERLLEDLGSLEERVWLVIDDVHELQSTEAVQQLERLLAGAPEELRFVLLTRRDLALGLHRLRLDEELTEIRGEELRFTLEESRALLDAAGVRLSDEALEALVATTEGWAAGLRLAALSMITHSDPDAFAASFSGRERTVAEYLLAEVLEHQPDEVTRLLLRTSVLERVTGALADRLTGGSGSERILWELEDAGAFVVALDPNRSWFRYHHLFADLLALELRRVAPDELPELHTTAAEWLAEHGYPIEAVRHAQAAEDWGLAAQLLADPWVGIYLDGRLAANRELLSAFPAGVVAASGELAVLAAAGARWAGSLDQAERHLRLAARASASVPQQRRERFEVALSLERLALARARNDLDAVAGEAQGLLAAGEARGSFVLGLDGGDLRTLALANLGVAEVWTGRLEQAERHLEQALAEARDTARPLLELQALAHLALLGALRPQAIAVERARQAIELARKHGWEDKVPASVACIALGAVMLWRARLQEAESWLDRAEIGLRSDTEPTAALMLNAARTVISLVRGQDEEAATTYRAVERMAGQLVAEHTLASRVHSLVLQMQIRAGETERVKLALAEMDADMRESVEMRVLLAMLRLAQGDPEATTAALAPIFDGSVEDPRWEIQALLLEAKARDALRDPGGATRALESALDLAETTGLLLPFLLVPVAELLEGHSRLRATHASLVSEILILLSGRTPAARAVDAAPLQELLSDSELRVLRYLPTNLQGPEIAAELFVSLNTIRTHQRHLYAKLGVHRRAEAVERARALGLLAPRS